MSSPRASLRRADEDSAGESSTNVKLRYNGEIVWDSPAITKSSCVVDVSYFPFDWQQCKLTFGSWTYNGNQVCLSSPGGGGGTRVWFESVDKLFMRLYILEESPAATDCMQKVNVVTVASPIGLRTGFIHSCVPWAGGHQFGDGQR